LLATFDVNNVEDVEDIAVGPGPMDGLTYLYLGDIGGNVSTNEVRASVKVIRIPEPRVELAWAGSPRSPNFDGTETFTLLYPDGSYDAETLLVDSPSGDVLVVTKQAGTARFYTANLMAAPNGATLLLQFVRAVPFDEASSGDISADGSQIVLRHESFAQLWPRCPGQSVDMALSGVAEQVPLIGRPTEPNGEGIGFLRDGTGYVTISEGNDPSIYFFRSLCPAPPRFTLSLSNESVFAGGSAQFSGFAVGFPDPAYSWRFNGQLLAGQTNAFLWLSNVTAAAAGQYQLIASNASGTASNAATLTVRPRPDLRITEVMANPASSPGVATADWWELTSFESQPVTMNGWRFNDNAGGLGTAYTFPNPLVIAVGESIVFVEGLSAAQFRNWWGASNLPPALQIITYSGAGLGFGNDGDGLRLWDNVTVNEEETVARADFGAAMTGVTFNYEPSTEQFGGNSQLGINGVIRAAAATDIGSPGRILAPVGVFSLQALLVGDRIRIEFDAVAGQVYTLEARNDVAAGGWASTGDNFQATTNRRASFEKERSGGARYFRVRAD